MRRLKKLIEIQNTSDLANEQPQVSEFISRRAAARSIIPWRSSQLDRLAVGLKLSNQTVPTEAGQVSGQLIRDIEEKCLRIQSIVLVLQMLYWLNFCSQQSKTLWYRVFTIASNDVCKMVASGTWSLFCQETHMSHKRLAALIACCRGQAVQFVHRP